MPTYSITAPNGKIIDVTGDSPPSDEERQQILAKFGQQEPAAAGYWEDKGIAGKVWHPPGGGNPELHREDNSLLGLPPEAVVIGGIGIGRAMTAPGLSIAQRALAGVKAMTGEVTPYVKFEAVRRAMEAAGTSPMVALSTAFMVSGYRPGRGAAVKPTKAAMREAGSVLPAEAVKAGVERYGPNVSGIESTAQTLREATPAGAATRSGFEGDRTVGAGNLDRPGVLDETFPPPGGLASLERPQLAVSHEPMPTAKAKSPQQLLNEEAIARRRAAIKEAPPTPALSEAERLQAEQWRRQGISVENILARLEATRAAARPGTAMSRGSMTPDEVAAEIAARYRNRSPRR